MPANQTSPTIQTTPTNERKLPTEPEEQDKALRPYRVFVRPIVGGVSKAVEQLGADGLDTDERASGEFVGAAYLYEYGAELSAKVLLALWVVGTLVPRVPQIVKHFQGTNEEKQLKLELKTKPPLEPETEESEVE